MPTHKQNTALMILAAGHGSRMKSRLPKVLHAIGHLPMLGHVLKTGVGLSPERVAVVIGSQALEVGEAAKRLAPTASPVPQIFIQDPPQGTGDAVRVAMDSIQGFSGVVFVLYADTPLLPVSVLLEMREILAAGNGIVVLGFRPAEPGAYGRLVTDSDGALQRIVEAKDASLDELAIPLCNSGVMAFDADLLRKHLPQISNDNAKGEYYLTDMVALARAAQISCAIVEASEEDVLGVNSRVELAEAEAIFQSRARHQAMLDGATLRDPASTYFSHDTSLGRDVVVGPCVVFGPGVVVEDGAEIKAFSHLEGAHVAQEASIGPYARLRPGANIGEQAKIGNFVEVKKSDIAKGAKVSHLSYIGDAVIGAEANIGAGTITCNYDGYDKHITIIGAGAFIGSNTALVAPITIGDGAYVGSGSVIVKNVSEDALVLTRSEQVEKPDWAKRYRTAKRQRKNK
jgi:bifunctional UDP-N-acetylglucosamine pyrophosphorylase / glucosamine-1-phosphate N-acetyltransferase